MKIYNEEKTQELIDVDKEMGYLRPDRLIKEHHEAIPEYVIKTVNEQIEELIAQGEEVTTGDDGNGGTAYYHTVAFFPKTGDMGADGREVEPINPIIEPAKEAWDEYEEILVYHSYNDEEYVEYLRRERERICFPVINRGAAWYARLTPEQNAELQEWYDAWLNVTETKVKPETPSWV